MQFKVFLLLLFCIIFYKSSFCQPIENRFTHYTAKDGLPEGDKAAIVQDSTGFIWIGTENGLARFDGYNFKVYRYRQQDTNSLRENRIINLFIDSKKRLWALSFHWLYLYHPDGEWFEHYSLYSITNDMFVRICAEEKNNLVLSGHNSLYKFDEKNKKITIFNHEGIDEKLYDDYKMDECGIEWITGTKGIYRYEPKTRKCTLFDSSVFKHNKNENIGSRRIIFLPGNNMLVSTYNYGLILFNRKTYQFKQYTKNKLNPYYPLTGYHQNFVYDRTDCMYKLNDSIILCSVGGGVSVLNLKTDSVTYFLPNELNPVALLEKDIRVWCIFKDREGVIWLGGKNLEKYDFKNYNFINLCSNSTCIPRNFFGVFFEVFRTAVGNFIMGNHGGMNLYNPVNNKLYDLSDIPYHRITNFNEDAFGNIWCYKNGGLCKFNIQNNKIVNTKRYEIPYKFGGLYDVKLDLNGRVLIATSGSGLLIFDTTKKQFTTINANTVAPSQLNSNYCLSICADHNGFVWVGTQKGLNRIDKDGYTVLQFNKNKRNGDLLQNCYINDIKEDRYGIIWFATNELGIGRYDQKKDSLSFISVEQGLPTCKFDNICIDNNDNLWAITATGNIVVINVVSLINKLCTEDEGFPAADDVNAIHYSAYTKKMYILTKNAIIEITGKLPYQNNVIPPAIITSFSVFGREKSIIGNSSISLNYNENFINIQFACLQYHNLSQIKYAYKLDGVDKDWVYSNYIRNAPYTDLDPGKYVFNVKAQSPTGIWNNHPTQLIIIIHPPFWQTWWFYLLEFACLAAIVLWIFRLYLTKRLNKQKVEFEKQKAVANERQRIASDIHDDLGAGLTSIRLLSEIANLKTTNESAAKTEIEKIVKSAESLAENLKEIIWTMNSNFDKLGDFIIYIRGYSNEFFSDSNVDFQFIPPDLIPNISIPGELRRNLFLCIKEALNNIIKHAHATKVIFIIEIIDDKLVLTITDNGVGINFDKLNKFGNGLSTMKKRLEKLDGELEIIISDGTKLVFKVGISKEV